MPFGRPVPAVDSLRRRTRAVRRHRVNASAAARTVAPLPIPGRPAVHTAVCCPTRVGPSQLSWDGHMAPRPARRPPGSRAGRASSQGPRERSRSALEVDGNAALSVSYQVFMRPPTGGAGSRVRTRRSGGQPAAKRRAVTPAKATSLHAFARRSPGGRAPALKGGR